MKRTGKLFALLAAIVMALVLVPGVARGDSDWGDLETSTDNRNKGTISIVNPKVGETYSIYCVFNLASFTDNNTATGAHEANTEAYSYLINDENGTDGQKWISFLTEYGPNGQVTGTITETNFPYAVYSDDDNTIAKNHAYFIIERATVKVNGINTYHVVKAANNFKNAFDYMGGTTERTNNGISDGASAGGDLTENSASPMNSALVQDFAQEALKYAVSTNITHTDLTGTGSPAVWSAELPLGYYLVGTSMGTLTSLDTNNRSVNIREKNDEPGIEKKVLERGAAANGVSAGYLGSVTDEGSVWVENTDADVGDYVMYRTVITAEQGAKSYVLHDVMEKGLTFAENIQANATKTNKYENAPTTYKTTVFLVSGNNEVHVVPNSIEVNSSNKETNSKLPDGTYINWVLKWIGGSGDAAMNTGASGYDGCDFEIEFKDADGGNGSGGDSTTYGNDRVTFVASTNATNPNTYDVYDIKDGDKIVVTYWAQLTQDARIYGDTDTAEKSNLSKIKNGTNAALEPACQQNTENDGDQRNTNAAVLTYGGSSCTAKDTANVTTYQFDIAKTKIDSNENHNLLPGATFFIFKAKTTQETGDTEYKYTPSSGSEVAYYYNETNGKLRFKKTDNTYLFQGDQPAYTAAEDVDQLVSANDIMNVRGLESGTYILVEDKAPNGYNKLAYPIIIAIDDDDDWDGDNTDTDGQIAITTKSSSNNQASTTSGKSWDATILDSTTNYNETSGGVEVVNQAGTELPSTGGLGTKAFYAIGGSLFAASVIFLLTKKRLMQAA